MTRACQHCRQPLNAKRANARYCSQRCRRAAFSEAPAEVQRVVQGKRGWGTVTIRCAKQPAVNAGDITEPLRKRSERLSEVIP